MPQMVTDAQGLAFLRQQSIVLSARAFEQQYDITDYASLVPVNTDYPEWASGVDFQIGDMYGAAQWQSGWAKDVPVADVRLLSVTSAFAMYAVGYRYNTEEIGKAMFAGYPLTARKAAAARQAADIFAADVAMIGGGHPGWTGLINLAGVTPSVAPNNGTGSARNWVDASGVLLKTPEQIIAELNLILMGPVSTTSTLTTQISDTLLLPPLVYRALVGNPYGVTSPNMSIMQYFAVNNEYTNRTGNRLTIRELSALADAATATTPANVAGQGRAIGYRNNLDSIELPMPMPFNFLPDIHQYGPLQWEVPGIGRVGQLVQLRDGSVRYHDGVSPAP